MKVTDRKRSSTAKPKVCRGCGVSETDTYLSARYLCHGCAVDRAAFNASVAHQIGAWLGKVPGQAYPEFRPEVVEVMSMLPDATRGSRAASLERSTTAIEGQHQLRLRRSN